MTVSVCLCMCVCLSASVSRPIFTNFCSCYLCRCLVLLYGRCDTLRTSGFMDDVIFAHNGPYLVIYCKVQVGTATQPDGAASLGH